MKNIYIKSIYLKNFRGYKGEKEFDFTTNNQPNNLILLSGANGYGKTSLIDAIEWCLTGTIKRIYDDYNVRCSTKMEQGLQDSDRGLIKNVDTIDKDVIVKIKLAYKGIDVELKRYFVLTDKEIEGLQLFYPPDIESSEDSLERELMSNIKDIMKTFEENHICSYEKNIEFYTKGRKDIYDIFSFLYTEFKEATAIKNSLNNAKTKLTEEKDKLKNELDKISVDIDNIKKLMKDMEEINLGLREEYPENRVFEKEELNPYIWVNNFPADSQIGLSEQTDILQRIYYHKIKENVEKLQYKLNYQNRLQLLNKLEREVNFKKALIEKAEGIDFEKVDAEKNKIQELHDKIQDSFSLDNMEALMKEFLDEDTVKKHLTNKELEDLSDYKNTINSNMQKKNLYSEKLKIYDTSSPIMLVMRYVVDNVETLQKYKKESDRCPVCGSQEFANSEIGVTAKKFLGDRDIERQEFTQLIKEIDEENSSLIKKIRKILVLKLSNIIKLNNDILSLGAELKDIFQLCKILNLKINSITNKKTISFRKLSAQLKIRNVNLDQTYEEQIISALEKLDLSYTIRYKEQFNNYYDFDVEQRLKLLNQIVQEFNSHQIDLNCELLDNLEQLSFINIETKINICKLINKILAKNKLYQQFTDIGKKQSAKSIEFEKVKNQITELNIVINKITKTITENEKKELERIAEPLDKIYRKITRNTNIREIKLNMGKGQNLSELVIIDSSEKSIPFANILSAGQLSTLSISVFLAKALLNNNNFRFFLMDEPIQTMDDLNILSFVDLIRFELGNKEDDRFIDQLIISTCDSDLEKLIVHKIKGFNIPICNYNFEGQGSSKRIV